MRKHLNNLAIALLVALVVLLFPGLSTAQQNYLTQTTLTAAQSEPAQPGAPPVPSNFASVASVTGINAYALNGTATINTQNSTSIYVDGELETVVGINGTTLRVLRGQGGTKASAHASGAMVLAGRPDWFYVRNPGSPSLQGMIYPANSPCVLANVYVSPWVNIRTGEQWVCSPTALTWQPGFGSPFLPQSASMATTASVGGATNIAFPMTKISGTNAITSFTFTGNGAIGVSGNATANKTMSSFCVIPTGAFTTVAGNNIGSAQTAVVGQVMCWYWNGPDAKWYVQ